MTILTINAETSSQFNALADLAEIRDESGRILGYFHPLGSAVVEEAGIRRSPFSVDELRGRQRQRSGRSLAEILAKLETP
ncbi:MAG TPA: hypothetical protein VF278_08790 [Pirellulales bacterium]